MKYSLKDYQEDAVHAVLANLNKASKRWHEDGDRHALSLTATTGAGKTVMAAAVFEALFHGDDNYDFESDPGAVVIWFSDDPALNAQSHFRLHEASDRLTPSDLTIVQNTFNREKFEPGKVYFLNTQKLSKSSLLVRGHDPNDPGVETDGRHTVMPDTRAYTIWDTIQNTVEDPDLTLYLVLDEAHRGMKTASGNSGADKQTIVKRLINGSGRIPAIPIVLGISATVERFNSAMADMEGRSTLPNVKVDSGKVQASGLLKDTIILDVPDASGRFETVLVRRGTDKLKDITDAWEQYFQKQGDADTITPLMVLQVPNSPDPKEIGLVLDTIQERWPGLRDEEIAHVFGDHTTQAFGAHSIAYISPERVQESTWVRVLIAKDAISTGWDCPRAEVMVSFRPANDRTHITQLLGRMVRTPLAMRIPGNERLNAVECILPFFDAESVNAVANELMSGDDGAEQVPGRRVLIKPAEMLRNPDVPEAVWDKLLSLPTQKLPKVHTKPVKRLTSLAHELAADGILPEAGKKAHEEMHKALSAARERYRAEIDEASNAISTVTGQSLRTDLASRKISPHNFAEEADTAVIDDAYRAASRIISPALAKSYAEALAEAEETQDDPETTLRQARAIVAALGSVPDVKTYLEVDAENLTNKWLTNYRIDIKSLRDSRRETYRQIQEMSPSPVRAELTEPASWMQPTAIQEKDGSETPLPRFEKHLLSGSDRLFPDRLNSWETEIVAAELARTDSIGWYRNPSRASPDSLGVIYENNNELNILRPDFIFFAQSEDGTVLADIVDPHGTHLDDSIPKLKGLANYAAEHGNEFRRIDAVAKTENGFRVLDLQTEAVRDAIESAKSAEQLYKSSIASDYVTQDPLS